MKYRWKGHRPELLSFSPAHPPIAVVTWQSDEQNEYGSEGRVVFYKAVGPSQWQEMPYSEYPRDAVLPNVDSQRQEPEEWRIARARWQGFPESSTGNFMGLIWQALCRISDREASAALPEKHAVCVAQLKQAAAAQEARERRSQGVKGASRANR